MTIQEKIRLFAKTYPDRFVDVDKGCPTVDLPCDHCEYSWGKKHMNCPLDDGLPYVQEIRLAIFKEQPELLI